MLDRRSGVGQRALAPAYRVSSCPLRQSSERLHPPLIRCRRSAMDDLPVVLAPVQALGGSVIHRGEMWAICKDSEGSPFGLAARAHGANAKLNLAQHPPILHAPA